MKRVVAFSDAHGDTRGLSDMVELAQKQGKVDVAVFLGDGVNDFVRVCPSLTEKGTVCHIVCGNNDWACYEPQDLVFRVGKTVFYACHGHTRYVKYGMDRLYFAAREREAHVVLYGHTHVPKIEIEGSLYLVNPGAVCDRARHGIAYAEILVEDNGAVECSLVQCPR